MYLSSVSSVITMHLSEMFVCLQFTVEQKYFKMFLNIFSQLKTFPPELVQCLWDVFGDDIKNSYVPKAKVSEQHRVHYSSFQERDNESPQSYGVFCSSKETLTSVYLHFHIRKFTEKEA